MINRNDLRINNLVQRSPNTKTLKIVEVLHFTVKVIEYDEIPAQVKEWTELGYREIEPAPLTKEWLLKFGFYQNSGVAEREYLIKGGYYMAVNHYENGFLFIDTNAWKYGRMIKYVHQLQNIYYVLTGEELTIKESATEP